MTDIAPDAEWSDEIEDYLRETAERAHGLAWIHKQSESRFSQFSTYLTLPTIVLSSLTGAASFSSGSLFGSSSYASVGVGIASLTVAVLNTIGGFFRWNARSEAHRISALQYDKLFRWICVQLALPRDERASATELIKYVRDSYDRLAEISPIIPAAVVRQFVQKFSLPKYEAIARPTETNGLETVVVNRRPGTPPPPLSGEV